MFAIKNKFATFVMRNSYIVMNLHNTFFNYADKGVVSRVYTFHNDRGFATFRTLRPFGILYFLFNAKL